jgi:hypothetical protein
MIFRQPISQTGQQQDSDSSRFRQLTSEHQPLLPKLTQEQITGYFEYRLATDKLCVAEAKALEKGKCVFDGKRIEACSVHITTN